MNIAAIVDAGIPFAGGVALLLLAAVKAKKPSAGQPKKSNVRTLVTLGLVLFLVGGFRLSRALAGPSDGELQADLTGALAAQSTRLNATTPKEVSPGLMLEHTEAKGTSFTYLYRFTDKVASQIDVPKLQAEQTDSMKAQGCKQPAVAQMLNSGAHITQLYVDKDYAEVARVIMDAGFCKT